MPSSKSLYVLNQLGKNMESWFTGTAELKRQLHLWSHGEKLATCLFPRAKPSRCVQEEITRRWQPATLDENKKTGPTATLDETVIVKLADTVLRLTQRASLSSALMRGIITALLATLEDVTPGPHRFLRSLKL